jgi:hypothetical protein
VIDILRWVLIILSIPLLVLLIVHTVSRVRRLSERIDEYHEEQEAARSQPGPINPYADMGQAFGAGDQQQDDGKRLE